MFTAIYFELPIPGSQVSVLEFPFPPFSPSLVNGVLPLGVLPKGCFRGVNDV